jgi:carbonic anhydrase
LRVPPGVIPNPASVRQEALRARAAAAAIAAATAESHGGDMHWSYEGADGPQNWGRLKPEFNVCAIGRRQSPINIEEATTLRGPAEPLQFAYGPSSGSVVNNGHTIQVDVVGENTLTVRDTPFKLVQFHFHHPSEERVNHRSFAMVAHLVHRSAEGQLAVLAVLLDPGEANNLIHKVWTHMPLDSGDRVRMPAGSLNLNELLPQDQRYYQFIGSLTTPPCTEGVLWLVLKQPAAISRDQLRLFGQMFPNNARPVQPVNGRPVREAQ